MHVARGKFTLRGREEIPWQPASRTACFVFDQMTKWNTRGPCCLQSTVQPLITARFTQNSYTSKVYRSIVGIVLVLYLLAPMITYTTNKLRQGRGASQFASRVSQFFIVAVLLWGSLKLLFKDPSRLRQGGRGDSSSTIEFLNRVQLSWTGMEIPVVIDSVPTP